MAKTKTPVAETIPPENEQTEADDETKAAGLETDADPADTLAEARDQAVKIRLAKLKLAYLEGRAKEAKDQVKDQEAVVADLQRELEEIVSPTPMPLYNANGQATTELQRADDAWRADLIREVLDLPVQLVEKLSDASVATMGELADLTAESDWWTGKIKGVGKAAAEKISEATERYWAARKHLVEAEAE